MNTPKYIIKTPVYKYAKSYYYIDILEGKYTGLQFNFSKIEVVDTNVSFVYNLLRIPSDIEVNAELEQVVGDILNDIIERGYYEFDTK
jgi:hypothetical protein